MYLRLCLLIAYCFVLISVWGQGSPYQWRSIKHSFGGIKENGGDVKHRFAFVNKGMAPLTILSANASCGCTAPSHSKEAIQAGDSGYVEVVYHPAGRPGPFSKTVTVTTDGLPAITELVISGNVLPKVLTVEDTYPDTLGHGLRIMSKYLNLGEVSPTRGKSEGIYEVVNTGKVPLGIKVVSEVPWATFTLKPKKIAPGDTGKLYVSYSGKKRKDYGYVSDPVTLGIVGATSGHTSTVYLMATIQELLPAMSPDEAAKREHLTPEKSTYDYGTQMSGKVATAKIILRNTGKAPLKLYAAKSSCKCIRTELESKVIAPGGSSNLFVHFDPTGYLDETTKPLTIYSSDPMQPAYLITLKANVLPAPGEKPTSIE
jgi:Protein of unknown function (DUF1573)